MHRLSMRVSAGLVPWQFVLELGISWVIFKLSQGTKAEIKRGMALYRSSCLTECKAAVLNSLESRRSNDLIDISSERNCSEDASSKL